ncbi:hypothetical protein TNCV_1124141 [Trichonephila clavipes]|uniref:Uncharacterized protein n=1 Tax=Trichonephila clavipes TaxID=2585209 RepID=A0A8X6SBG4_TRICX|nr:hypothetical protein TNCV_1124141 [Trichonephila clavipes]
MKRPIIGEEFLLSGNPPANRTPLPVSPVRKSRSMTEQLGRKTDFFPEEDTAKSYSGFEPEPIRLQAEGHSQHTGWATTVSIAE